MKELWAGATSCYDSALAEVQHAIELAEQELAQQTGVSMPPQFASDRVQCPLASIWFVYAKQICATTAW